MLWVVLVSFEGFFVLCPIAEWLFWLNIEKFLVVENSRSVKVAFQILRYPFSNEVLVVDSSGGKFI